MFEALQQSYRFFFSILLFLSGCLFSYAQAQEIIGEVPMTEEDLELTRLPDSLDVVPVDSLLLDESEGAGVQVDIPSAYIFELLTCSPGPEVYELYGHTALRVRDALGLDVVFNYGVFDFIRPYFVWNFVLGKTDYMVQPIPYNYFIQVYEERGSSVIAQRLNLTATEGDKLMRALMENSLPQNREYRYNYLTNNCTTKVRDMIEHVIEGEVRYWEADRLTYRECLHHYTQEHPWAELGDDILLGASVDTILTDRSSAFLPERLKVYYDKAVIFDMEGNSRPLLVGEAYELVEKREVPIEPEFPLSPFMTLLAFAGLSLLVFAIEVVFKRMIWGYDLLIMPAQGLCGLLLCFMFFFSEHPSVDSNWQIWLFNPLPLVCMPWVVWRAIKHRFCLYHLVNMGILVLFLVFSPWIPQHFASVTLPLACILLLRPVSYYISYSRNSLPSAKVGSNEDAEMAEHEPPTAKKNK